MKYYEAEQKCGIADKEAKVTLVQPPLDFLAPYTHFHEYLNFCLLWACSVFPPYKMQPSICKWRYFPFFQEQKVHIIPTAILFITGYINYPIISTQSHQIFCYKDSIIKFISGLPWWCSRYESTCERSGHGFDLWYDSMLRNN